MEREFTGPKGRREAGAFFPELARHGTTTAMLYTAIYEDSAESAFQAAAKSGLRIIMGKMMMDVGSYGNLQPTKIVSISLHESERLCKTWHGAGDGLVEYAFSPRFAVACSEKLHAQGRGDWPPNTAPTSRPISLKTAKRLKRCEISSFGRRITTEVYEKCRPPRSAHHPRPPCISISATANAPRSPPPGPVSRIARARIFFCAAASCPWKKCAPPACASASGSDVAAGPELNLWQVMYAPLSNLQKAPLLLRTRSRNPLARHLPCTWPLRGSAEALGKGKIIGSFDIGKEADLTIMDYSSLLPYRQKSSKATADLAAEDIVSLCIYRGGPHAVVETFVRGRSVFRALEPELF